MHAISWQTELSGALSSIDELLEFTGNRRADLPELAPGHAGFALRVPRPFARRIQRGQPTDPLLRQVLPLAAEEQPVPGYVSDPLDESSSNVQSGVIHKYQGRVLLVLTGACAINCRYCFRRHFPYQENRNNRDQWQEALDYIRNDDSIHEVIFSGGDPLLNNDHSLGELVSHIADIPHVTRLRLHTRLPVVIPQRITEDLITLLTETRLQTVMVVHINHPAEIDAAVREGLSTLRRHGIMLLNQSVLLQGINDDVKSLRQLSECLFDAGVLPYYLHVLDKVAGAAHFDLETERARRLAGALAAQLPGYLVPKLVCEIPGKPAKVPLLPVL